MERVQVLIHKLATQGSHNESPAQLLATVQLLYAELLKMQPQPESRSSKKVAVVLPRVPVPSGVEESVFRELVTEEPVSEGLKAEERAPQPVIESPVAAAPPPPPVAPAPPVETEALQKEELQKPEPYVLRKPAIEESRMEAPSLPTNLELPFDAVMEVPTLNQQTTIQKELHELLGEKQESLNDRLKKESTELVSLLSKEPIKDLRKGIGVNDKFLFINELFRGDEAMYERSIKTINNFHILQEAEYWINRELKVKLGWDDGKETVQHFYQVVRRRFS